MTNSLFHPPSSFITGGGLEGFYEQEMRKIVNGVELDTSMEEVQEELTPDGTDMSNDYSQGSDSTGISMTEQNRLTALTNDWESF